MPKFYGLGIEIRLSVADFEPFTTSEPIIKAGEDQKEKIEAAERAICNGQQLAETVVHSHERTEHVHFLGKDGDIPFFIVQARGPLVKKSPEQRASVILQKHKKSEYLLDRGPQLSPIPEEKSSKYISHDHTASSDEAVLRPQSSTERLNLPSTVNPIRYGPWDTPRSSRIRDVAQSSEASHTAPSSTIDDLNIKISTDAAEFSRSGLRNNNNVRQRVQNPKHNSVYMPIDLSLESRTPQFSSENVESEDEIAKLPPSPARIRPSNNPRQPQPLFKAVSLKVYMNNDKCNGSSDVKIDVYFNGKLSNSTFIPSRVMNCQNGVEKGVRQSFAGTRFHRVQEAPWILMSPKISDGVTNVSDSEQRSFAANIRWNEINAALNREAIAYGFKSRYCDRPPTGDYLHSLANMKMPEGVMDAQTSNGLKYGVIDVVVSLGKGKKFGTSAGYLTSPQRLFDKSFQNEISRDTDSFTVNKNSTRYRRGSTGNCNIPIVQVTSANEYGTEKHESLLQDALKFSKASFCSDYKDVGGCDKFLAPLTIGCQHKGPGTNIEAGRTHSTGTLTVLKTIPAEDDYNPISDYIDVATLYSPRKVCGHHAKSKSEQLKPRFTEILFQTQSSSKRVKRGREPSFVSTNSHASKFPILKTIEGVENYKSEGQRAAILTLDTSIITDERSAKITRTSVASLELQALAELHITKENTENPLDDLDRSSEISLNRPVSPVDTFRSTSGDDRTITDWGNAQMLALTKGYPKSTKWLMKRIKDNGQIVPEQALRTLLDSEDAPPYDPVRECNVQLSDICQSLLNQDQRDGTSAIEPLTQINLVPSPTFPEAFSTAYLTTGSYSADQACQELQNSRSVNEVAKPPVSLLHPILPSPVTIDEPALIGISAAKSEGRVLKEENTTRTHLFNKEVSQRNLTDLKRSSRKSRSNRGTGVSREKPTHFVMPEESKNCVITYPEGLVNASLEQGRIPLFRQIRAERGGNFQEEAVLMGVRFVIGVGAGFP